jgi:uncharacterized protein YbjT (DUF2867 family)
MSPRTALLVGATGLVGGHCLRLLLADPRYRRVVVLARRPLDRGHGPEDTLELRVTDFDTLGTADGADVPAVDDVYCALGTTIRAAGSREAFYRVDHDYPVTVARLAREAGATRFALVSSIGASPTARNYYLRMKGETERDVAAVGYECVELFRPSMLLGRRAERRPREAVGMAVMRAASPLLAGGARAYRPVDAGTVAAAMLAAIGRGEPGTHVRTHDDIQRLAPGADRTVR